MGGVSLRLMLLLSLLLPSLMDREVALLGEMDKVKAEASKAFTFFFSKVAVESYQAVVVES